MQLVAIIWVVLLAWAWAVDQEPDPWLFFFIAWALSLLLRWLFWPALGPG